MISRRSFLGTIAAAIAVGFAKVETAMVEHPGPLVPFADWVAQPPTLYFDGIPCFGDNAVSSGVWMGISRDFDRALFDLVDSRPPHNARIDFVSTPAGPSSSWVRKRFLKVDPYVDVDAPFPPRAFKGASGDPTSDN